MTIHLTLKLKIGLILAVFLGSIFIPIFNIHNIQVNSSIQSVNNTGQISYDFGSGGYIQYSQRNFDNSSNFNFEIEAPGLSVPIFNTTQTGSNGYSGYPILWYLTQETPSLSCFLLYCGQEKPSGYSLDVYIGSPVLNNISNNYINLFGVSKNIHPFTNDLNNQMVTYTLNNESDSKIVARQSQDIVRKGQIKGYYFLPSEHFSNSFNKYRQQLDYNNLTWSELFYIKNNVYSGLFSFEYQGYKMRGSFYILFNSSYLNLLNSIPKESRELNLLFKLTLYWKGFGLFYPDKQKTFMMTYKFDSNNLQFIIGTKLNWNIGNLTWTE